MRIKGMKDSYQLILCKVNGDNLGIIPYSSIKSFKRGISTIGEMTFTINKSYGVEQIDNPLYFELKEERLIKVNDEECYVIKKIKEKNDIEKEITAYSREKKLTKNKVDGVEDISITLMNAYTDIPNCYSLNDLLYDQTGWKLGYVSNKVLYDAIESIEDIVLNNENIELSTNEKLRYQESIKTNWYDYITDDITEQFECYPIFDSYNKVIDLYSEDEIGEEANLILTYDNYLKSKEKTFDTSDIVTRLVLEGNEDLDILEYNPTGLKYLENYSYFIENDEMSQELIKALNKYDEMVEIRTNQWYTLRDRKAGVQSLMSSKQTDLLIVYNRIKANNLAMDLSDDEAFKAQKQEEIVELNDDVALLEKSIGEYQSEINDLNASIDNINNLCKKEYATDENGILIFNTTLLDELKEFIYQDTYTNDNITDALTLMKIGKSKLKEKCRPTLSWTVDSINFVKKLIDNEFRQQWKGELGLGDKLILKRSDNLYEEIYLIGYVFNPVSDSLELQLSNKKGSNEFTLSIGEKLTKAEESFRKLRSKQYLFNQLEKNRYGVKYDKINKEILQ